MSAPHFPAPLAGASRDGVSVVEVVEVFPKGSDPLSPVFAPPPRDLHPARVYLASLSPGSRRTMRAALENVAGLVSGGRADALTLPWHELRYQHTTAIRSALAEKYAPATANKMLSALRGVIKECWRLGYIGAEERDRACDLSPVRGKTLPKGRSLSSGERKALFEWCADDEKPARGARDAALLAVLYVCGLRRGEVPGLDLADFDPDTGELKVRHGKGAAQRIVYATGGAGEAIEGWILHRGEEPGPLFWPVLKSGRPVMRRISDQTVYDVLKRLRVATGSKGFSPHDFRRTFVSDLIDARGDISVAQQLAGHASPETTARYDRRGERAKKEAAEGLHVPYRAPDRRAPQGPSVGLPEDS